MPMPDKPPRGKNIDVAGRGDRDVAVDYARTAIGDARLACGVIVGRRRRVEREASRVDRNVAARRPTIRELPTVADDRFLAGVGGFEHDIGRVDRDVARRAARRDGCREVADIGIRANRLGLDESEPPAVTAMLPLSDDVAPLPMLPIAAIAD